MKTSLDPAEYELVQGVFKSMAQSPWFDRTPLNEKECAKLVLRIFATGIADDDGLLAACLPEAHNRFSKHPEIVSEMTRKSLS
jgi:hypothetical protein